ncbi:MAG: DNA polymerase III subunit gamma/tau [Verrucomicrobia bacterium]|nr:DNA polymerase III subunit gamma/tau [Verrucomicrobiota bacterium]
MSYQVIARKYRPQRFEDVVGQEHVTTTLMNAIRSGRIAHGYLFCGPRGTGKTTLARIFAKALNATGGPRVDFSDDDPRVKEITEGRSLDVLEIDGASNNGVEQVRELRDTARFAPASGKYKLYIIDEVHMLSTAAFNALLKTLEEPPAHVKFIFATTDPEKVLPTILSRCQRFDLRRIPTPLIVEHLGRIAQQEQVELDDAALHAIARGADGGMRDAQSTLDQLISFCGTRIVESDVLSMFGLASRGQLLSLAEAVLKGDAATALRLLDELARGGKDLGRLLGDVLSHFRNLLLMELSGGDRRLVEVTDAEWTALQEQARQVDATALGRVLEVLSMAEGRLREAPSKRIFLEVTLLKAIDARNAVSLDAVLKQLKALREGEGKAAPLTAFKPPASSTPSPPPAPAKEMPAAAVAPSPLPPAPAAPKAAVPPPSPVTPPSVPAPTPVVAPSVPPVGNPVVTPPVHPASPMAPQAPSAPAAPIAPGLVPVGTAAELWSTLYASLERSERMLWTLLTGSVGQSWTNLTLTVACSPDALELASSGKSAALLKSKLKELVPGDVSLKFVPGDIAGPVIDLAAPVAPSRPRPSSAPAKPGEQPKAPKSEPIKLNKDEFLADPLIQAAMGVFRAQLIEVRGPSEA